MIKGTTCDERLAPGISLLNKVSAQYDRIKELEAEVAALKEKLDETTARKNMFFRAYMDFVRGRRK